MGWKGIWKVWGMDVLPWVEITLWKTGSVYDKIPWTGRNWRDVEGGCYGHLRVDDQTLARADQEDEG